MRKIACHVLMLSVIVCMLYCVFVTPAGAVELTEDDAYIYSFTIDDCLTGTAPWDDNNGPGNDMDESNSFIRSFDTIMYSLNAEIKTYDTGADSLKQFDAANVCFAFVLPCSFEDAEFVILDWMKERKDEYAYQYVKEENRQILYCTRRLEPTNGNIGEGSQYFSVSIYVKGMKNGSTLQPEFYAWLSPNDVHTDGWDGTPYHNVFLYPQVNKLTCSKHLTQKELWHVKGTPLTVSAKIQLDVYLSRFELLNKHAEKTLDFDLGSSDEPNYGRGKVTGVTAYSDIYVALRGDSAAKGMRGIEYPEGPIKIEIELGGNISSLPFKGEGYDFAPLLYCANNPAEGYQRTKASYPGLGTLYLASSDPSGNNGKAVIDSGKWTITQDGTRVTIVMEDYVLDGRFARIWAGNPVQPNIGYFASGRLVYIFPYYNQDTGAEPEYILDALGLKNGAKVTTSAIEGNLIATSVSGETISAADSDGKPTNANQKITNNDAAGSNWPIGGGPGQFGQLVLYYKYLPSHSYSSALTEYHGGSDWTYAANRIAVGGGVSLDDEEAKRNYLVGYDEFIKIDGEQIFLLDEATNGYSFGRAFAQGIGGLTGAPDGYADYDIDSVNTATGVQVLYVVKADGSNWANDDEMRKAWITDVNLRIYTTLTEAKGKGAVVGVLYQIRGERVTDSPIFLNAMTNPEAESGTTVMLTHSSRAWRKRDLDAINELLPEGTTPLAEIPMRTADNMQGYYADPNLAELIDSAAKKFSNSYYRAEYAENGMHIDKGNEPSEGDTLLIVAQTTSVQLAALNGSSEKTPTFDMDNGQTTADFAITPYMSINKSVENETSDPQPVDVTIVQKLPKGLEYIYGSSYWGGTYVKNEKTGFQGTVTDGIHLLEGNKVSFNHTYTNNGETITVSIDVTTTVTENADGTTTITYLFSGVPRMDQTDERSLFSGARLFFSTDIQPGTKLQWELQESVSITSTNEKRAKSTATTSIIVFQSPGDSISGKVDNRLNECDAELGWTIHYASTSNKNREDALLMSVLPQGSYEGNYTLTDWAMDVNDNSYTQEILDTLTLYCYTGDLTGQDASDYAQAIMDIAEGWTKVAVQAIEGKLVPNSYDDLKDATGWILTGTLPAQSAFVVHQGLEPSGNAIGDTYQNVATYRTSNGSSMVTRDTAYIIGRELSGVAWLDADQDGLRDENEMLLSGVKTTLQKKQEDGSYATCVDVTGNQIAVITTNENGEYCFPKLGAGEYRVVFEYAGATDVTMYQVDASEYSNDAKNEAGQYVITEIQFSTLEAIRAGAVVLDNYCEKIVHEDIGLIRNGSLSIAKQMVNPFSSEADQMFSFTLELKQNGAVYVEDLNYTGGVLTGSNAQAPADGILTADNSGLYSFMLRHGQIITIDGIPDGIAYAVSETADNNYVITATDDSGIIKYEEPANARFVNIRKMGDLIITKSVESDRAADIAATFEFVIVLGDNSINGRFGDMDFIDGKATVYLKGGENTKAIGLPASVSYTVAEKPANGFTTTSKNHSGTISTTQAIAEFVNTRETVDLTIQKIVKNGTETVADKEFQFTLTLGDTSISGTYGDLTFDHGVATFILQAGASMTASGLPTDVTYEVAEKEEAGFDTDKAGNTGVISAMGSTAVFTNTYSVKSTKTCFPVKKVLSVPEGLKSKQRCKQVHLHAECRGRHPHAQDHQLHQP